MANNTRPHDPPEKPNDSTFGLGVDDWIIWLVLFWVFFL